MPRVAAAVTAVVAMAFVQACSGDGDGADTPTTTTRPTAAGVTEGGDGRGTVEVVDQSGRRFAVDAAMDQAARTGIAGKRGTVVALDPATGRILTMVSSPQQTPNSVLGQDSVNTAAVVTFPPGQTFVLVTAAAGIASGKYQPDTRTNFESPMRYPNANAVLTDQAGSSACQGVALQTAFERSCNTVFAGIGAELGDATIRRQAEAFGFNDFGKNTGADLSATKDNLRVPLRVASSVFPTHNDNGQTMRASIGQQDVLATPLQMAMVAAAIANDGKVMEPYLATAPAAQPRQPRQLGEAVDPVAAEQLRGMMIGATERTCPAARIQGAVVGAKAGAALRGAYNRDAPYSWFVAFGESGGKRIAVAVVIQDADAERNEISGCQSAAPIAISVLKAGLTNTA